MRQAKADAEKLLAEANAKIENTIRTIKEAQADKEKTKEARLTLSKFKEQLANEDNLADNKISRKLQKLKEKDKRKKQQDDAPKEIKQNKISIGDNVRIKGQVSIGQVVDIQKGNAIVALGMIKSTAKLESLEYVSKNQIKKESKNNPINTVSGSDMREKKLNFKLDIDVRGMRGDEALQAVMYFIDDAILVGVSRVRILHGTGTGALRQIIRDYLQSIPSVSNYQDEHVQFGGTGITVVDLE